MVTNNCHTIPIATKNKQTLPINIYYKICVEVIFAILYFKVYVHTAVANGEDK